MARVLVTGGRGLLGGVLVPRLRAASHDVVTCSRSEADIHADLSDPAATQKAMEQAAPEVVVNLAARTNVDECEKNPQLAFLSNVRAVENLAAGVRKTGGHLIQISTDQIYDGANNHTESDVTITNYYGLSKYAGELAASLAPSTILRTNFFGRSRSEGRASLSDWVQRSLVQGSSITVFEDVLFSPLSMTRLAEMLEMAVARRRTGVFNLGSRDGMSKADFAFAFAEAAGLPTATMKRGRSSDAGLGARRPKDMRMDSTLFEKTFGVRLPHLTDEIRLAAAEYAASR